MPLKPKSHGPVEGKWHTFANLNVHLNIMVRHSNKGIAYAPLYIHKFQFIRPHFVKDAEKLDKTYIDASPPISIRDKLRHYRLKQGLTQGQVADLIGIKKTTYSSYEKTSHDYYPIDTLKHIAILFKIDIYSLLDDYNTFLHDGQASQLKSHRNSLGLQQNEYAALYDVTLTQIKRWEEGKVRMSKKFWEQIFNPPPQE